MPQSAGAVATDFWLSEGFEPKGALGEWFSPRFGVTAKRQRAEALWGAKLMSDGFKRSGIPSSPSEALA